VLLEILTIGSVGDGAGGGAAAPMTIAAGVTATFSGTAGAGYVANVYTDLGATTVGAASTLVVSSTGATFTSILLKVLMQMKVF
jgi:hypothetical protein